LPSIIAELSKDLRRIIKRAQASYIQKFGNKTKIKRHLVMESRVKNKK
jgi:hypothetical protein